MTSNEGIGALLNHPFYYFMKFHLLSLAVGGIAFMCGLMAYIYRNDKGVYRNEEEHGSARFATADELSKFADENPDNNMIFTKMLQWACSIRTCLLIIKKIKMF